MKPRALILLAPGTNRHLDVARALELAGSDSQVVPLARLRKKPRQLGEYQMLVVPGGFSYADSLGAGRLLALDLQTFFADELQVFVASGKPVLGICNGFQALVKSGVLPGNLKATLTFNEEGHFQCRWVRLRAASETCVWTRGLRLPIDCPVAHGEGNFRCTPETLKTLEEAGQVALFYAPGSAAVGGNPNGSLHNVAGICNSGGTVLGLMPHPENHLFPYQHPLHTRREPGYSGLPLFQKGVEYAAQL